MIKIEMKNTYQIFDNHAHILLGDSGDFAIIDIESIKLAHDIRWYRQDNGYIVGSTRLNGVDGMHYLHKRVMKAKNILIDHIDRNKTNNKIENLRAATKRQNNYNRSAKANSESGYKGVSKDKRNTIKVWRARINVYGKELHIGNYTTKEEAALAYNEQARKYFKEFAYINEIK